METQVSVIWALAKGTRVGDYIIDGVIGVPDRFGVVYAARELASGERIGLHEFFPVDFVTRQGEQVVIRSEDLQSAMSWGLLEFLNESGVLARVSHPSLVEVRRTFEANGTGYYAMEYLSGELLLEVLLRNPEPTQAFLLELLQPLIEGLEQAHAEGFLHRDIEPSHIIFRNPQTPVLVDFGAGQNAVRFKSPRFAEDLASGYAAPEQYTLSGRQGPWTDIYALAAIGYRVIAGRPPPEALERQRGNPMASALSAGHGRFSDALLQAVDWALSLDPTERPQSLKDWRSALLGQATTSAAVGASPPADSPSGVESQARPEARSEPLPNAAQPEAAPSEPAARVRYVPKPSISSVGQPTPPRAQPSKALPYGLAALAVLGLAGGAVWLLSPGSGATNSPFAPPAESAPPVAAVSNPQAPTPAPTAAQSPAAEASTSRTESAARQDAAPLAQATGLERLARDLMIQQATPSPAPEPAQSGQRTTMVDATPEPSVLRDEPAPAPAATDRAARILTTEDAAALLVQDPRFTSVGSAGRVGSDPRVAIIGAPAPEAEAPDRASDAAALVASAARGPVPVSPPGSVSQPSSQPELQREPGSQEERPTAAGTGTIASAESEVAALSPPAGSRSTAEEASQRPGESESTGAAQAQDQSDLRLMEDQVIAQARRKCWIPAPDLSVDGRLTYERAQRVAGASRSGNAVRLPPVRLPDGREVRFEVLPDSCARLVR